MIKLLLIAAGGGVGAMARHLLTGLLQNPAPGAFPVGTLVVNVLGCLVIGFLYIAFQEAWHVSQEVRLAVVVGVLGGFTTFSSFGQQTFDLAQAGKLGSAAAYVVLSNVLGIGAVVLGAWAARATVLPLPR